jgi:hypothetical protein
MKNPVVRIVELVGENRFDDDFLLCLGKAGLIVNHEVTSRGYVSELTDKCFDIKPPHGMGIGSHLWCVGLADNLAAVGINAVVARSTE